MTAENLGLLSDEAQLINYLKTTGLRIGLLFNFGSGRFEMLRRIF